MTNYETLCIRSTRVGRPEQFMRATAKEKFMKRIHKMFTALCAAIAAVVLAISFAACGNAAGTYKFSSMELDMGGMKV